MAAHVLITLSVLAFVVLTSVRLARRAFGAAGTADTIIRTAILAFASIVLAGLAKRSYSLRRLIGSIAEHHSLVTWTASAANK